MSLLKQDNIRKKQIDESTLEVNIKNKGNNKEYKLKTICDNEVDARTSKEHFLV